jgi:Pentapeptide repeats (8 copies)
MSEGINGELVRVHVECKNYKNKLKLGYISQKLVIEGMTRPPIIDLWILISPHAKPANNLESFLRAEEVNPQYSFGIQVWSPDNDISEFFGLAPDVYDQFYQTPAGEEHPRNWNDAKSKAVREKWKRKLERPLRLPKGWAAYLKDSAKLCSSSEIASDFHEDSKFYVPLRCRNTAGALMAESLNYYVDEWLAQDAKPTLFLLGEFGDGKTCFTYVLAKQLVAAWLANRDVAWLPLRLTLKDYRGDPEVFLERRLAYAGVDYAGWVEMGKLSKRLIILDGFDEMPGDVGPETVTQNINNLIACVEIFKVNCKILITSRAHFFENNKNAMRLLDRIDNPTVYHLAALERKDALASAKNYLANIPGVGPAEASARINQIAQLSDPIGLACKPLFLSMLKEVLSEADMPVILTVYDLYENYIDTTLSRKKQFLDDPHRKSITSETILNVRLILGKLAESLQRFGNRPLSLKQFAKENKSFSNMLWNIDGDSELKEDAENRIRVRSLLHGFVGCNENDEWVANFCHRSMKEYFVAIRLCEEVDAGLEAGAAFLKEVPLNFEILQFAVERWGKSGSNRAIARLLELIDISDHANSPGTLGGYALTLLHWLQPILPRDKNWQNKVFDGANLEDADISGMNFSGASFIDSNLANVNFENADLTDCNLTQARMEETKAVLALALKPSGEELIALYADGILRQWEVKSGSKMSPKIVGKIEEKLGMLIGFDPAGSPWGHHRQSKAFLVMEQESWQVEGNFPVNDAYDCIYVSPNRVAFTKPNDKNLMELVLVDLDRMEKIATRQVKRPQWIAVLGAETLIWSESTTGFLIARDNAVTLGAEHKLEMPLEATCLDVYQCTTGRYVVASGTSDGRIFAWQVDVIEDGLVSKKVLETQAHNGPVTTIVIRNDGQLASGGADRAIILTQIVDGNIAGGIERTIKRTLRCTGMRITGIKGPNEYSLLKNNVNLSDDGAV